MCKKTNHNTYKSRLKSLVTQEKSDEKRTIIIGLKGKQLTFLWEGTLPYQAPNHHKDSLLSSLSLLKVTRDAVFDHWTRKGELQHSIQR